MSDEQKTLAEEAEVNEILKRKTGIFIAVPNLGSKVSTPMTMWLESLTFKTVDRDCPFFFKVFMPNDLTPVEWARNQCVMEFLKDPYFKKLWFVDADMNPPFNALDLLDFDEPIVSGMTYIWMGERFDEQGYYIPPLMKVNAFDYRKDTDDFISRVPTPDGKTFRCDATGAACLVIRRDVLEDMPEPWFRTPRDPYGRTLRGEDMDFTYRATQRGYRPLYIPRVQFEHIKEVDLKMVCSYGMASMRAVIDRVKNEPPEKMLASLPVIRFPGEKPTTADLKAEEAPQKLVSIEGGKRI